MLLKPDVSRLSRSRFDRDGNSSPPFPKISGFLGNQEAAYNLNETKAQNPEKGGMMEMRFKAPFVTIALFFLLTGDVAVVLPYIDLKPGSALSTNATIPLTPGPLLDDFTAGEGVNVWRGATYTISSDPAVPPPADAVCNASFTNDSAIVYGSAGKSLQLTYNVSRANSYAGYVSNLGGASTASYNYLSFWVKGAAGGEFFKITLSSNSADANRNKASVYITDYLQGGVTTSW